METIVKNKESIIIYLNTLCSSDLVLIHNQYCLNNNLDNDIYHNDEDFFKTYFGNDIMGALRAASYGEFKISDEYLKFNGYGNFETTNSPMKWVSIEDIANAILENCEDYSDYIKFETIDVIVEDFINDEDETIYSIIDESGCTIETDFELHQNAVDWANDNGYNVVDSFNI